LVTSNLGVFLQPYDIQTRREVLCSLPFMFKLKKWPW
jgi:hypothetical protein